MRLIAYPTHPAPRFHTGIRTNFLLFAAVTAALAGYCLTLYGDLENGCTLAVSGVLAALAAFWSAWSRIRGFGGGYELHIGSFGSRHMLPKGEIPLHDLVVGGCGRSGCFCEPKVNADGEFVHNRVLKTKNKSKP
jgi:hypothetical protein